MSKELVDGFKFILAKIPTSTLSASEIHMINVNARHIFKALASKDIAADTVLIKQLKETIITLEHEKEELELRLLAQEEQDSQEATKPKSRKTKEQKAT